MTSTTDPNAAHQDQLIGTALPTWLRGVGVDPLQRLQQTLSLSLYFDGRVTQLLGRLQSIESFARSRLDHALTQASGRPVTVADLRYRHGEREPVITPLPVGVPMRETVYYERPALEAALRNFNVVQAEAGEQPPGAGLRGTNTAGLPHAHGFARLCREVDVGGAYQAHLSDVLEPSDDPGEPAGTARRRVLSLLARQHRYALWVDAQVAHLKGQLSADELALIDQVCKLRDRPRLHDAPVEAKRLRLLGCTLEHVLVLDVRDEAFAPIYCFSRRVLVHIPGDPVQPWRAFDTLRAFANALGKHLRTPAYQRFFSRCVRRADAAAFFDQVQARYAGLSDLANCALDEHLVAWEAPLFDAMALARIAQIKADARAIAIPTAELDEAARAAHDRRLVAEGWGLVNLAGFFVPAIGVALLAVTAWELLGEVYHGVQAWRDGDASEAMDHVLNVATDLAVLAATAAGVSVARTAWQRVGWIDDLAVTRLEQGGRRLWRPDPAPWRLEHLPEGCMRDALGVHRLGDRAWVRIDRDYFPVQLRADERWQLLPRDGHGPEVAHNGAGAWRFAWEQPLTWDDPDYLLRRLGDDFASLDDDQCAEVRLAHAMDATHLRAMHASGVGPISEWRDTLIRYRIDARIRDLRQRLLAGEPVADQQALQVARRLPGATGLTEPALGEHLWGERRTLFQRLYQYGEPTADAAVCTLQRQFPRLHVRAAQAVIAAASPAERARLMQGRVPLRVAEAARVTSVRVREARVVEGLMLDAHQDADLARVCMALLSRRLPENPRRAWRLHDADLSSPALLAHGNAGAEQACTVVHFAGRFQGVDSQGRAVGDPSGLFETLAASLTSDELDGLGLVEPLPHNLRVLLGRWVRQGRDQLPEWLGLEAPATGRRGPARQNDGRIGYPLSGRRSGRRRAPPLHARIRLLYPTLSDVEIEAWLEDLQQRGASTDTVLGELEDELQLLRQHLRIWAEQPRSLMARAERTRMRDALLDGWQRRLPLTLEHAGQPSGYRLSVWAMALGELPQMPARVMFSHVTELSLMGMNLTTIPESFLRAFGNLRVLEMANNELTRLPAQLDRLTNLRELDMYGNQVVLDEHQALMLSRCTHLRSLNLSFNPLGRTFSMASMPQLRRVHLRCTQLPAIPPGLLARPGLTIADLRNNAITELPEALFRVPLWISGAILLAENPIHEASAVRLRAFMMRNGWLPEPGLVHPTPPLSPEPDAGFGEGPSFTEARERWVRALGPASADAFATAWDDVALSEGSADFLDLLRRMQESVDFVNDPSRVAGRVEAVLLASRDHAELRQALFDLATTERTCQDSVMSNFSALEVRLLVWQAQRDATQGGEQAALLRLGRQLWRLDALDHVVLEDLQTRRANGSNPDEIEVRLAYRLALRDEFELPGQPDTMAYPQVAGVDALRIVRARAVLREGETDEAVARSLVGREFWQTHLVSRHAATFERLDQGFYARLQVLEEMAEGRSYSEVLQGLQQEGDRLAARLRYLTAQPVADDVEAQLEQARTQTQIADALHAQREQLSRLRDDHAFSERLRELTVPVSSEQYRQWMLALNAERQAAREQRMLELTREALAEDGAAGRISPQPGPSRARHRP